MSLMYGIVALISLCMVGICIAADKKHDAWLILVFVSVSVCNLGYFILSISKDLGSALNANRISYLGSVFLPFFLLMMVLRFCGIKPEKWACSNYTNVIFSHNYLARFIHVFFQTYATLSRKLLFVKDFLDFF